MKNREEYFTELKNVKSPKEKDQERKRNLIQTDISNIDKALKSTDSTYIRDMHITLDGRYQSCIADWGKGMYGFNKDFGFYYDDLSTEALKDNLKKMRPKLEAFLEGWNTKSKTDVFDKSNVNVIVNNSNSVSIMMSFDQVKQKIEDLPGLTQKETEEMQKRIDELERIYQQEISKKKKWELVKPIIQFSLDKGADVAIAIMSLILQMKLGIQ